MLCASGIRSIHPCVSETLLLRDIWGFSKIQLKRRGDNGVFVPSYLLMVPQICLPPSWVGSAAAPFSTVCAPHAASTLPRSFLLQKFTCAVREKGTGMLHLPKPWGWTKHLTGNPSPARPSSLLARVLQRERILKMTCRSETSKFYYYKNILVSCHSS